MEHSCRFIRYATGPVEKIRISDVCYSSELDRMIYGVDITLRSGQTYAWESTDVGPAYEWQKPAVDSERLRLFSCSTHGICCVDIPTGRRIWKSPRFSYGLVFHGDVLGCHGVKSVYTLDSATGKLIGERKATAEFIPFRLSDHEYFIRFERAWHIMDSPSLEVRYTLPDLLIPIQPRSVTKEGEILIVDYWDEKKIPQMILDVSAYRRA